MVKNISEEEIRKAMAQVKHPAINRTLIDLGIIKDETIKGSKVTITIALPSLDIPIKDYLIRSVREPIEKLNARVEVKLIAMNQEELRKFLIMEQESWKGNM
ncbi:DUF59 domain-containing protein [Candidatus Aerophobetes bacterium]|nr:DUF59 domain-containing protein [Candidatus Aerophobetes bacterium]